MFSKADHNHMRSALAMAQRGLGRTWPNPAVGCVIVKNGQVIARARTHDGGRPHAETGALEKAGKHAEGATLYVTLEPCSHQGQTPPCVQAIINAGIKRVVVALKDPDEKVNGQGLEVLKKAGIEVDDGLLEDEAQTLLSGYILNRSTGRPFVTLKIASTLDEKIATASGESQWITGELARRYGHLERAQHDGILVGSGTVEKDNPSLTARLGRFKNDPVRILFDTNLRLSTTSKVYEEGQSSPVWVVCDENVSQDKENALKERGVDIVQTRINDKGLIDISEALKKLNEKGMTRLLVEGGPALITSFIKSGLYDRILWFRAAKLIGQDGLPAIQDLGIDELKDSVHLKQSGHLVLGEDRLDIFEKL